MGQQFEPMGEYEPPALAEVGAFADLTSGADKGQWIDMLISWFDF